MVNNVSASLSLPCFQESRTASSIWISGSWKVGCRRDNGVEAYTKRRIKLFRFRKVVICRDATHSDTRETFNGDLPILSTDGKEAVVWTECNGTYGSRVLVESEPGVCRRVPERESGVWSM